MVCGSEDLKCWEAWENTKARHHTIRSPRGGFFLERTRGGHHQSAKQWNIEYTGIFWEVWWIYRDIWAFLSAQRYHLWTELNITRDGKIILVLVPGQVGFRGNSAADSAAVLDGSILDEHLPFSDLQPCLIKSFRVYYYKIFLNLNDSFFLIEWRGANCMHSMRADTGEYIYLFCSDFHFAINWCDLHFTTRLLRFLFRCIFGLNLYLKEINIFWVIFFFFYIFDLIFYTLFTGVFNWTCRLFFSRYYFCVCFTVCLEQSPLPD